MDCLGLSGWFFWRSGQGPLMKLQADHGWDWNYPKSPLGFLDSLAFLPLHVASGLILTTSPTGYLDLLHGISELLRVRVSRNKGRSWNLIYELAPALEVIRMTFIAFGTSHPRVRLSSEESEKDSTSLRESENDSTSWGKRSKVTLQKSMQLEICCSHLWKHNLLNLPFDYKITSLPHTK